MWRLQHARLVEFKRVDARIQVLAVVLVGVVGMAREPDRDYMGIDFAIRVMELAHRGRVPAELEAVLVAPHRSARVIAYDRDTSWCNGDAVQDGGSMLASARHARPVWSAYYQTAFFGLERQDLRHGGHLRWAEPDAVARGGAPPESHAGAVAARAARAASLGLFVNEFESLPGDVRQGVAPGNANAAYDAVHCRERFRALAHDHPGFWTPRAGYLMTPMWHSHFPDDALVGFRTPARDDLVTTPTDSSAAGPAPGGSRPACPGRTSPSARPDPGSRTQSGRAARLATCCLRRRRAKTGSEKKKKRAHGIHHGCQRGQSKRLRNSA